MENLKDYRTWEKGVLDYISWVEPLINDVRQDIIDKDLELTRQKIIRLISYCVSILDNYELMIKEMKEEG